MIYNCCLMYRHYNILDKMKILAQKWVYTVHSKYDQFIAMHMKFYRVFLRLKTEDDPRRRLLWIHCICYTLILLMCYIIYREKERDALLEQLKQCLIEDRKKYFNRIKPKIVEVLKLFLFYFFGYSILSPLHFCFFIIRVIYKSTRESLRLTYLM